MWGTIAAVAAPIVGGIIGADQANKDRKAAGDNLNQAREIIGAVQVPELKEWLLQQYASAGTFTPEMLQAIQLGATAQEGISTNPAERMKQVELIDRLIAQSQSGVTPEDRAAFELANRSVAGQNQAQQSAIIQNMQQRGVGGSGIELAQRLAAQQNASDALQQAALQQASQQNALRLQALQASTGALSGLRSQDYGQALNLANAQDQRSMANWQNQQNIMNQNTGNLNAAQQFNLANRQRLMDNNTQLANQQQQYNYGQLPQAQYGMNMQKAQAMAGQYTNAANQQYQQAGQTAAMYGGIGQGIGTIMTAMNQPGAPKYDTKTGQPLYDPQTGKPYGTT